MTGFDPENRALDDNYDTILNRYLSMTLDDYGLEELFDCLNIQQSRNPDTNPFNPE